jgi:hypothetical protein
MLLDFCILVMIFRLVKQSVRSDTSCWSLTIAEGGELNAILINLNLRFQQQELRLRIISLSIANTSRHTSNSHKINVLFILQWVATTSRKCLFSWASVSRVITENELRDRLSRLNLSLSITGLVKLLSFSSGSFLQFACPWFFPKLLYRQLINTLQSNLETFYFKLTQFSRCRFVILWNWWALSCDLSSFSRSLADLLQCWDTATRLFLEHPNCHEFDWVVYQYKCYPFMTVSWWLSLLSQECAFGDSKKSPLKVLSGFPSLLSG